MEQSCGAAEKIRSRWVSVCQTELLTSAMFYPALLRYILLQPLMFSPLCFLPLFYLMAFLFQGSQIGTTEVTWNKSAESVANPQCVCVVYLGSGPPGRPPVFLITKTTSRTTTRYCQERIKSVWIIWMFSFKEVLAVTLCVLTCAVAVRAMIYSRWLSKRLANQDTNTHKETHTLTHTYTSSKSCEGRAWLMACITVDKT